MRIRQTLTIITPMLLAGLPAARGWADAEVPVKDSEAKSPRQVLVDSPAAAKAALQKAKPGDTVVLADGVYRDAGLWIGRSGTAEAPLVVRAQTSGKVTFTGNMRILLACRHVVVDGFTFDQVWSSSAIVRFDGAEFCRVTNCAFVECGDPKSSRGRTIDLTRGSKHNRIDHCYMQGNLSQGMGTLVGQGREILPTHNRFDHNYFKDISKRSPNGQEAIQLGQGSAPDGSALEAVVEWNLFDNASGDAEIISVKAHHNTIRFNTFQNCEAELTLRGGFYANVEGNWFFNNRGGIRVFGTGHVIANNYMVATSTSRQVAQFRMVMMRSL